MWNRWKTMAVLGAALGGLCTPASANTTAVETFSVSPPPSTAEFQLPGTAPAASPGQPRNDAGARIALLLPLRSDTLEQAAQAVRAGFLAAHEREKDGISVNVIETGDAVPDMLSGYGAAVAQHDIVVGPLSRSGATAIAQSGAVGKPTVVLTQPDIGSEAMPPQMLAVGLSIEDEARQAALWAGAEGGKAARAIVVHTATAWQRRAAKAFAAQWQRQGGSVESIELNTVSGFLSAKSLVQVKQLQSDGKLLFAALDANQAQQLRLATGNATPMYGTSQLNPFSQPAAAPQPLPEMEGVRLIDIPWQLQPDHPAVMVYPRPVIGADQQRSPDMERLYALGIDAYRIAREIALRRTSFAVDGVTGRLTVRFGQSAPFFERIEQHAVYRDGGVVPEGR